MRGWLVASAAFFTLIGCTQSNIVQINSGSIEGTTEEDYPTVAVYRGIPYAKPPIDELRWAPPQPVEPWEGVQPATDFSSECMQTAVEEGLYSTAPASASEDCLYLNVWTDTQASDDNRPVMVWIHGGAFILGSGSTPGYNGADLASKGVVVVTINYRLGVLGFFAHPALSAESEHGVSGNQGIYDQIAALQWVQDNIANFGGDPNNVTIFGESAGSISVCYLVATPLAKGLFQKAIGQSGGCFGKHRALDKEIEEITPVIAPDTEAVVGSGYEIGAEVASALGFPGNDQESLAELRNLNALTILETLREAELNILWRSIFVDGYMFPDQMRTLVETGQGSNVDVIVGSTRDEGTALFPWTQKVDLEVWRAKLVENVGEEVAEILIAVYEDDAAVSTQRTDQEILSDQLFAWEMRKWARINESLGKSAYLYVFNHAPTLPDLGQSLGAFHASEIAYIFGTGSLFVPEESDDDEDESDSNEFWTEDDQSVQDVIQTYWLNFAKNGDPNGEGLPTWPAYQTASDQAMEIKVQSAPVANYRGVKLDTWEELMARPFNIESPTSSVDDISASN